MVNVGSRTFAWVTQELGGWGFLCFFFCTVCSFKACVLCSVLLALSDKFKYLAMHVRRVGSEIGS